MNVTKALAAEAADSALPGGVLNSEVRAELESVRGGQVSTYHHDITTARSL